MRDHAASTTLTSMLLVLAAISAVVVLSAGCGRDEPADPLTPQAAPRASDPAAPSATANQPRAPEAPKPADTPLPPRPAAEPPSPIAAEITPTAATGRVQPRPSPTMPALDLHDSQIVTSVGQMRTTMAPWRDGGGNRLFSTQVFGTPFMLNEKGEAVPWIATAITSNERMSVWTMKLREDAVFQDGTPITAADFKAYWEHGAKPVNIVAWGGASLTLDEIVGWEELRAGDTVEAEGLTVVDDHTLEIETYRPTAAFPLYMAAWHVGISKLDQVKAEESTALWYSKRTENWGTAPIGAGPYSLTYNPDSGLTELTRTDLVGWHWNGPHDTPIIEKLVLPNIEDEQARLIMFENGELDVMSIDTETYEAALDPGHPFNPLLYVSPYGGLWFLKAKTDMAPLDDLLVRKALAHGQDMESIVSAIWGPTATHAKGLISSLVPCHDPDADYQPYDPDLALQYLSDSSYGSGSDLPLLMIDLRRPGMIAMGVAMKEYWKDNLDVELNILKLESGVWQREGAQFWRASQGSWIPDPMQIVGQMKQFGPFRYLFPYVPPPLNYLIEHARSLPVNHPDRCAAFQAFEREYVDKVYMIPIREVDPVRWVVQPWLRGFESTFNLDFNTLTTAYVARH